MPYCVDSRKTARGMATIKYEAATSRAYVIASQLRSAHALTLRFFFICGPVIFSISFVFNSRQLSASPC